MPAPDDLLEGSERGVSDDVPESEPAASDDGDQDQGDDAIPEVSQRSSGADGLDRKLAADAYKKVMAGQTLTSRELSLLRRLEKDKEERLRWQYYSSISQKHWTQMSGRQAKVLIEQQQRYDLPLGGKTIDLTKLARAFHDFLADNAHKLSKDDDELMQGNGSPALERYREERAAMARLDRLEREGSLINRDDARQAMGRIASILRGAAEMLQRDFGAEAGEVLIEALVDAEREIQQAFGDPAGEQDAGVADSQ